MSPSLLPLSREATRWNRNMILIALCISDTISISSPLSQNRRGMESEIMSGEKHAKRVGENASIQFFRSLVEFGLISTALWACDGFTALTQVPLTILRKFTKIYFDWNMKELQGSNSFPNSLKGLSVNFAAHRFRPQLLKGDFTAPTRQ